ncbi:MAG TPA: hypothetical protein DHV96_10045 [Lachnospiraceae bacterium]|nr:hypothetical protein [Lachnospiraceae bacterium]
MERTIRTRILKLCMLLCFGVMAVSSSVKADSISETAQSVSFGTTYNYAGKEDKSYKIIVPSSGKVSIHVVSTDMNWAYFPLYDANVERITSLKPNEDFSSITGKLEYSDYYYLTPGTYYLQVDHNNDYFVNWQISFDFQATNESFTNEDDTTGAANVAQIGQTYTGLLGYTDKIDYYKVDLGLAGKLTINVSGTEYMDYRVYLYSQNGTELSEEYVDYNEITHLPSYSNTFNLKMGTYYYAIERVSGWGGIYQVGTSFVGASESFPDTGNDDYIGGANPIAIGTTYYGQIANANLKDDDYYAFTVETGKTYILSVTAEFTDNCNIYDGAGNRKKYMSLDYNKATGNCGGVGEFTLPSGTYYLRFGEYRHTGNYSFAISEKPQEQKPAIVKPGKVKLKKVKSPKKRTLRIQWHKVAGVSGYEVEVKNKHQKLTCTALSTKATAKYLTRKKKYKVRVRAYVEDEEGNRVYGAWSKRKTIKVK